MDNIKEQLITFETAKLAKEKGFHWTQHFIGFSKDKTNPLNKIEGVSCHHGYNDCYDGNGKEITPKFYNANNTHYPRPSQSLLQRWLREMYNIHVVMKPVIGSKNGYDSYPVLGWDFDIIMLNKNSTDSYYLGNPIGDWFTGIINEGDTLDNNNVHPKCYDDALEDGLVIGLKCIK